MIPRWLIWSILAILSWGLWSILSKLLGDALSAEDTQSLSTLGMLPIIGVLAFSRRLGASGSRAKGFWTAFAAGILTFLGNAAYFFALSKGEKAATVIPLTALYPLVTVLLAVLFLRERLNRVQCGGVLFSLAAIYLFSVSNDGGFDWSKFAFALWPILLWGISGTLQKISTNHLTSELAAVFFLVAFIPASGLMLALHPISAASVTMRSWLIVGGIGFFFALGNYAFMAAFASGGKASIISPLGGLYPLISIPLAIFLFGEKIGIREGIAIFLALLSVAALSMESPPKKFE
jgi:transporter family protein